MKISVSAQRRINVLISGLSDDLSDTLLKQFNLDNQTLSKNRLADLDKKFQGEWSTANFRKLWIAAEIGYLFNSWVSVWKTDKIKFTQSNFKKKLTHPDLKADRIIVLELIKKPKLFLFATTLTNNKSMNEKASTDLILRDTIYWFQESGIALTILNEDENGEFVKTLFENKISKMEKFRFIALVISKFYNENRIISKLAVNAMAQITGFDGLNQIEFEGDDVKAGLGGLHRRQDIRVHLDQIGPNIAVSTENLELKIGNQVKINNFAGINDLQKILYPESG